MAVGQIITGTVTVVSTGTPVALTATANTWVRDLKVIGDAGNTGGVAVGDANAKIASGSQRGVVAGKAITTASPHVTIAGPVDLAKVYVDALDGEKASFMAVECRPPAA